MARYVDIECDAVTEVIGRKAFRNRSDIQDFLDNIPTADVVPVVRCKDCKWLHKPGLLCTHKRNRVFNTGIERDFNCYCSYGERRCKE